MREIEFTIDPATGELTIHVKGIKGPACADVGKLIAKLAGPPTRDEKTADYYAWPQTRTQTQAGH